MAVKLMARFKLVSARKDEPAVAWAIKAPPQPVIIRLDIGPADAAHEEDWFSLRSTDGTYQQHRKVKDDHTPGDKFVDLLFEGLDPTLSYSLEIDDRRSKQKHFLFENVPYAELAGLRPKDSPEP